jgi:putative endonuclease
LDTVEKGAAGESIACQYLIEQDYRILGRNQRTRRGELDIVARSPDGILCFVEVKASHGLNAGDPASWITPRKVLRLQRAAQAWCSVRNCLDSEMRFDAITIRMDLRPVQVTHLPGAFLPDASGYY